MPEGTRRTYAIAVIPGDGIGPEVIRAAAPVLERAAEGQGASLQWEWLPYGADHCLRTGETLPAEAFERLRDHADAIFLGALGDERIPDNRHARDILLGLRVRLDLFINFRPCRLLHPDLCPLKPALGRTEAGAEPSARPIDFVIFRENTEGVYLGRGRSERVGTAEEIQVAEEVHSAPKVTRIVRAAFDWARDHGRGLVTMSDKANVVPAHQLWQRVFDAIGAGYTAIEREHRYIDALCMELVRNPERFQVIVTNNAYGDILSDLGAQLVGGLGLAASANLHPGRPGLFEPVHGSAPPLAGRNLANPMAAILTGALMLEALGLDDAARAVEAAVTETLACGVTTPDLGGRAGTDEVARSIAAAVSGR